MYVRHMAWLSATPQKDEKPRRGQYLEGSPYLELPFLTSYEQTILGYWFEVGTAKQTGQGIVGLEWNEIVAWANQFYSEQYVEWVEHPRASKRHKRQYTPLLLTQCTILDCELQIIKRMSEEYAAEYSAATDPNRPCPKEIAVEELSEEEKLDNSNKIGESLVALFGASKSPAD